MSLEDLKRMAEEKARNRLLNEAWQLYEEALPEVYEALRDSKEDKRSR